MICKDCIHYKVCKDEYKDKLRCSEFKNKADLEELDLYKRVVGKLRVNEDRTVTAILVGKEVEYIPKDLHERFKSMAVSSAKSEARKEIVEKLKSVSSLGDYPWDEERVYVFQIDKVLAELESE